MVSVKGSWLLSTANCSSVSMPHRGVTLNVALNFYQLNRSDEEEGKKKDGLRWHPSASSNSATEDSSTGSGIAGATAARPSCSSPGSFWRGWLRRSRPQAPTRFAITECSRRLAHGVPMSCRQARRPSAVNRAGTVTRRCRRGNAWRGATCCAVSSMWTCSFATAAAGG